MTSKWQNISRNIKGTMTVLTLLMTHLSFAQLTKPNQWLVYTKPVTIADPTASTFSAGIEKQVAKRWILGSDYGFKIASYIYSKDNNTGRRNYHFSKTSFELRYVLQNKPNPNDKSGFFYFGLRGLYFPQRYRLYNGYYLKNGNEFTYEYSDLKRPTWSLSFMSGHEIIGKHFVFNPYFGLGIRIITIHQQPYQLSPTTFVDPVDWDFSSHIERYDGTHIRPNFAGGFAFGYLIGK